MIRRALAFLAAAALLSCNSGTPSASMRPLELLAGGGAPDALDWVIPRGTSPLPLLDRLEGSPRDSAARALLQRDLWMTFDIHYLDESRLQVRARIARLLRDLALPAEEIARLPDTYVESAKLFPPAFDPAKPEQPFLPPDLFDPNGPWVLLASEDRPSAINHNRFFQWRSAFLIFVRHPDGREATRRYVERFAVDRYPPIPVGMEFANVRRALLISDQGRPVPSPITESVQLRHYWGARGDEQAMVKFELHRPELRLRPVAKDQVRPPYAVSFEHVSSQQSLSVPVMGTCGSCHAIGGPASVQTFLLTMSMGLALNAGDVGPQLEAVARLKTGDDSWKALEQLWGR